MATRNDSNEIRLTRVYDAPVRVVWDAWADPAQAAKWWGPRGFTITTHSKDLRPGGSWRYTMHGPDGVDYPNVTRYHVVEPLQKMVYDHGGTDDTPPLFRVTVTFTEKRGKTTMDMILAFPTPEIARAQARFIRQASGNSTWDRLAEYLGESIDGKPRFILNRTFEAPIARVFEAWTNPRELAQWLPPAGSTMEFVRSDIAVGEATLFRISGGHGIMHVRVEYLAIEPPHRIVYTQQFVDAEERQAPAPGTEAWPAMLRNTVLFTEEEPGRTRVTLTTEPHGSAPPPSVEAFLAERGGMNLGWSASFDVLEKLVEQADAS